MKTLLENQVNSSDVPLSPGDAFLNFASMIQGALLEVLEMQMKLVNA
jgi:hypothetical protein